MADACMNVMRHYNISASQKAIDWGNLLLTMGLVYGNKFYAVNERRKAEKAAKKAASNAVTGPFMGEGHG